MRLSLLCLCFSFVSAGNLCAQGLSEGEFKKKFGLADGYLYDGDYTKALPLAKELYEADSTNANLAYMLGTALLGADPDRGKAIKYLEQAVGNVSLMYKEGDYKEKTAPGITYYNLAKAYHFSYRFDDAISNYYNYRSFVDLDDAKTYGEVKRQIEYSENAKLLIEQPVNIKVQSLGSVINTKYEEYSPVISGDGNNLIFTSRREGSTGGKLFFDGKYYEDIYISKKERGKWTTPRSIGANINTDGHEATIGLSPDGQQLFIYKDDNGDGNIYMSKLNGSEWSKPEKVGGDINTPSWETHATISADGQNLFFVSNRSGTIGGRDIYNVSLLPNGEWSQAQNLGTTINTAFDEDAPFFSADGRTLIFSSQGHSSMGGFDIFTSEKVDGVWSTPVNIGYPINSPEDDVFFVTTPDGHYAYYSSRMEGGMGGKDIYLIELSDKKKESLTVMKGVVVLENKSEVIANIVVTDARTNQVTGIYKPNKANGSYIFILQPGTEYNVTYESDGFESKVDNIVVPQNSGYSEITRAILLDPVFFGKDSLLAYQQKKKAEEERLLLERKQADEQLLAEAQRKTEETRLTEEKIKAEESAKANAEQERLIAEKKKEEERLALETKAAEEKKKTEEATRLAEEKIKADEASKAKAQEDARIAAEKKKEEERLAAEAKAKEGKQSAEETARLAEEKKKADETAKAKEQEDARVAAEKKKEEERVAAEAKAKEEKQSAEETARLAEEKKKADEATAKAKEQEDARVATEKKKEEERVAAETKATEEKKLAEKTEKEVIDEKAIAEAKKQTFEDSLVVRRNEILQRLEQLKKMQTEKASENKEKVNEDNKVVEERLAAEEKRKAEEAAIKAKQDEETRVAAEKKSEEERVAAEEKHKAEEAAIKAKQDEETRLAEEKKKADDATQAKLAEETRVAAEKKAEEERVAVEEKRKAEEVAIKAKQDEETRLAEEKKKADEAAKAKATEEARIAAEKKKEEERVAAEEKRKSEEASKAKAEEARLIAEKKKADETAKAKAEQDIANAQTIDELRKINERLVKENAQLKEQIAEVNRRIDLLTKQVNDQNKITEEFFSKFSNLKNETKVETKETDFKSFEEGRAIVLENIFFDYNLSIIRKESEDELAKLYNFMSDHKEVKVEVSGHTDSHGNDEYNLNLSRDRANAVVRYLTNKGISASRLKAVGKGEVEPIAINENPDGTDNPEGRQLNRRIEIKILNRGANDVKVEDINVPKDLKPKS